MFVAAFPLAPLIALVTNLIEIRIDAINMIKAYRRPIAYKSEGIGVWYDILVTLTTASILSCLQNKKKASFKNILTLLKYLPQLKHRDVAKYKHIPRNAIHVTIPLQC